MRFRIAAQKDLSTLNAISLRSKAHWGYPAEWIETWKNDLTITPEQFAHQQILVVEINDRIIGFSSIVEDQDNYDIHHLWVLPEFIGQGIGKKLLQTTIDTFVQIEKPIIVEADPNAEPFYRSQGFETFDQIESFPKGRFLPVMRKLATKHHSTI